MNQVVVLDNDWKSWKKTVQELGEFDVALDLQGLLKSALPVHFAQAQRKLGYHWQREGARLFTQPVMPDPSSIHVVDQYVDVARAAGGATITDFGLDPTSEADHSVNNLISEFDSTKKLVVCHAGAGWATKRWPAEHFAALADSLAERATVAFIGTNADESAVTEVLSHCKTRPISLIGKTKVNELIALLKKADLHVAGDTGSIHIAAGLGKPCLGLYTLTKPERSCPYGQLKNCQSIDPDAVIKQAHHLLDQ
ncbi:MAG: glycosyltransferase family 9 protein [Fimbriimonadaceae bacterium]